ncbi:hypothetical protein AO062_10145 [Variovorax boronicumulans]|nr:hypothetical protein AO062_10145 [Variovorax boronicumulans]
MGSLATLAILFVFYAGLLALALYTVISMFQTDMWWQVAVGIAFLFGGLYLVSLVCRTKLGLTVFRWIGYVLAALVVISAVSKVFSGSFWSSGHCTESRYITC